VKLDVVGGYFGGGRLAGPSLPAGLVFGADVSGQGLPALPNLTSGRWMDEAFPLSLDVLYGSNSNLSLARGVAPKKPAKGETAYDYNVTNPSLATLTYTVRTGLFKGSFKVYFDGNDAKGSLQHKTVNVPYFGAMIPGEDGNLLGFGIGTATINKEKIPIPVFLAKD
jgi:hypothetical protein